MVRSIFGWVGRLRAASVRQNGWKRVVLNLYGFLLGAGLFLWPSILSFAHLTTRFVWLFVALPLCAVSIARAIIALDAESITFHRERFPIVWYVLPAIAVALIGALLPITFFGDEGTIALSGIAIVSRALAICGAPILYGACAVGCAVGFIALRKLRPHVSLLALPFLAAVSAIVALAIPRVPILVLDYPPLVPLLQILSALLTGASLTMFRLPMAVWWLLFGWIAWLLAPPTWSRTQRYVGFLAVSLTPLGWTYRILLYQQGGEVAFGLCVALLLASLVGNADRTARAALLGMTLALWIIFRPTAIAVAVGCGVLLLLLGYKRAAIDCIGISWPVGAIWAFVYLLGAYHNAVIYAQHTLFAPLSATLIALPGQLHPLGIAVALIGSVIVFFRSKSTRLPLLFTWLIGTANTVVHQYLLTPQWYGYGRYDILLMLPVAVVAVGFWDRDAFGKFATWTGAFVLGALLLTTPFNVVDELQTLRALPASQVQHSLTGGMDVTALPWEVWRLIERGEKHVIILSPDRMIVELMVAKGYLTPSERTELWRRSDAWTPSSADRPVLVQGPTPPLRYYNQGFSLERERRLAEAAEWAQHQPDVRVIRYGAEKTYVVP